MDNAKTDHRLVVVRISSLMLEFIAIVNQQLLPPLPWLDERVLVCCKSLRMRATSAIHTDHVQSL